MFRIAFFVLPILLTALLWSPTKADAAASEWAVEDFAAVRLISAVDAVGDTEAVQLALEFDLAEGWKIYWRSPGDAGLPPVLDWPKGGPVETAEIAWPAPHRFTLFGLDTFGYDGQVVLPVTANLAFPGLPTDFSTKLDYLACSDICVPGTADLSLSLPSGDAAPSPFAHKIGKALSQVPPATNDGPISLSDARFIPASGTAPAQVQVALATALDVVDPDLLIESRNGLGFAKPELSQTEQGWLLTAAVGGLKDDETLTGTDVTFTYIDGPHGAETNLTLGSGSGSGSATTSPTSAPGWQALLPILGLALLGGLILNLMPCVLPVLSMKLISVVGQGGAAPRTVRRNFLASAAGILVSFWLIAGALIAVKALGGTVGWGIQFQNPLFLTVMTIIVVLFACNLWGLFEISAPEAVMDGATAATQKEEGVGGHFVTGMFATLLATPCSAPFLGTAVAFALAAGAPEILAVFTALGIGLALPYLVVAAVPKSASLLPKPGAWMGALKKILSLALVATAVWLLSVLAASLNIVGIGALAGFLVLGVAALAWRQRMAAQRKPFATALTTAAMLIALFIPGFTPPLAPAVASPSDAQWAGLDTDAIQTAVASGQVVFVDVTADWCITCQVNKKIVLDTDAVQTAFADVTLQRGDWTLPSDDIARYLASFDRYGIPFNAVYGPGAPEGIALPELLTRDTVLTALEKASGQ